MKSEFYYPSSDAVTQIHAVEWIPEREVKAILQICHGMVEYVERRFRAKKNMDYFMRKMENNA